MNRHRDQFPTLASGIHLLSHSLGPVPRAVRDSMTAYCDAWEHHTSEDAWATNWWELSQRIGDRIARILGGLPGSVQIQPNASIALATVASCFDFKSSARNKVVTTALDFPSMEYIWEAQQQVGARVEVVPSDDGVSVSFDKLLDAIDDKTCLGETGRFQSLKTTRLTLSNVSKTFLGNRGKAFSFVVLLVHPGQTVHAPAIDCCSARRERNGSGAGNSSAKDITGS